MSRRPKLSLSPDNNTHKKQASGFFEAAAPSTHANTTQDATKPAPEDIGNRNSTSGIDKTVPQVSQTTTWPTGRQFVKVVLVVVAAALSLYLLKRRLL